MSCIEQVLEATPPKSQLYDHLIPITKTIKIRWTRHEGHCRRSKDELISDILLWTPSHGQAKAGWPAWTTALCQYRIWPWRPPGGMDNRDRWQERVMEICTGSMTWSWWLYKKDNIHGGVYVLVDARQNSSMGPFILIKDLYPWLTWELPNSPLLCTITYCAEVQYSRLYSY